MEKTALFLLGSWTAALLEVLCPRARSKGMGSWKVHLSSIKRAAHERDSTIYNLK